MRPDVGQIINGKYRLVSLLGDGGMGSVFLANHEKLKVQVALKFLHAELSGKGNIVERFMQEARASAQIRSEHVVRVSDVDQTPDGSAFIVLEYLEGQTLQALYEDYHKSGKRLSYAEALSFAMQMVTGLEAAHEAGVVHRDLKPDNVMITKGARGEPVLKLLDFGIAKLKAASEFEPGLTRPGVIMGTPEYMAPEQAYSADGVDGRADVFSLGVITFEMLAGRRPVGGDDPRALAQSYLAGQTAKLGEFVPNVAPELAAAVHKAMAPLAKDRFTTAKAFREAIEPFAASARPPSGSAAAAEPPASAGGSAPVMPPVALSAPGGTMNDEPPSAAAPKPEAGSQPVAKTWPPEVESGETKAMAPMLPEGSGTPGTVRGDMTALMPDGGGGGAYDAPPPAPRPVMRKKKRGMSVGAMLGIAGALGLAVAGFVVLATRNASSGDDDKPLQQPVQQPAIVEPPQQPQQQPGQPPPPGQPQPPPPAQPPPQPPPAVPPPQPHGPRPHPSGAPTAPPTAPTAPTAPTLPPGMPNIPGLPTAPTAPPTNPTTPPSAPPSAPPGIPGMPGLPPMPSGLPTLPGPFPPPPGG